MASQKRTDELKRLVLLAGSFSKAETLIKSVKGVAPTASAIRKSTLGAGTDYVVQSYVNDLIAALASSQQ
ncbi:hypothetical protein [Photobacterium kishitanii]|uniref:Uncharacterized protein n=1 Tax=Photobacterium kishitanii TaxID=318456 RepID=A0A2T3KL48_9GAMM|nr:hypothetical protein [Photobacterium kishitanii]PSV00445.1 hypothetical protein C9J27_04755 [Photobacterium kishitanii]